MDVTRGVVSTFKAQSTTYLSILVIALTTWTAQRLVYNVFFHPLSRFPGPKAAAATKWWKAFQDIVLARNMQDVLTDLHAKYGEIIRIAPNEIHFSNPEAYHEIYNGKNKWDKEHKLYHSMGEDRSSFGFLHYEESKERKDVLNRRFSAKAMDDAQGLVQDKVDALCGAIAREAQSGSAVDLFYGFRCMSTDVVTYLCFGKSVDALGSQGFEAPILIAMDSSMLVFARFKYSHTYKDMIIGCPPWLARKLAPDTAGMIDLQQILSRQIKELSADPEKLDLLPHHMTVFHQLMSKDSFKKGIVPSPGSLYEEAQALMFGGIDTTGNVLMVCCYHLMRSPDKLMALKAELEHAWPDVRANPPSLRLLEKLPYLNSTLKEGLRMSSGVVSGLLRIVPPEGAKIASTFVPGGTIVSCGSRFVHFNPEIFPAPEQFIPERWLQDSSLDNWMVAFSRGPRACLGINLAWMELRMALAAVIRRFDMSLDPSSPKELKIKDVFLPYYMGPHVKADLKPVTA